MLSATCKQASSSSSQLTKIVRAAVQQQRLITHDELYGHQRNKDLQLHVVGRAGVSGVVATVFGATGFLGSQATSYLTQTGCRVVCPFRGDGMNARHLKVMGDLGQVAPYPFALKDIDSLRRVIAGSNIVINTIGTTRETGNFKFEDVNIAIPRLLAKIAKEEGVERFIQVSALGASKKAPSKNLATKAHGEEAVKAEFPGVTIVRPADMFGLKDKFLNRLARHTKLYPLYPLISGRHQILQPVFSEDVARAFIAIINHDDSVGSTYELFGTETFTLDSLLALIYHQTTNDSTVYRVPEPIALAIGSAYGLLPGKVRLLTKEDILRQMTDIAPSKQAGVKTFEHLHIQDLTKLTDVARPILDKFRPPYPPIEVQMK